MAGIFTIGCSQGPVAGDLILENGSYFSGEKFLPFKEIVIKGDKIVSVNSEKGDGTGKRIDVSGKYIIPGLVDAHVHLAGCPVDPYVPTDPLENAKSSLLCGVTTVVDLFFGEDECRDFKKSTARHPESYSTTYLSGPILTAPGGHGTEYGVPTRTITSVKEAETITDAVINNGVDVIKLVYNVYSRRPSINKEMLAAIVKTAHKRGIKVFAHIDAAAEAMECIDVGVDVLAHLPNDTLTGRQLAKIKRSGIVIIPTFSVIQSFYGGYDIEFLSHPLLLNTTAEHYKNQLKTGLPFIGPYRDLTFVNQYRTNLVNCIQWDIPILAGTDAGNRMVFYGYSLHYELSQYVGAGMSPAEAISSATKNLQLVFPAVKTGRIDTGYYADIVILDKNPLQNIENTKAINFIIHRGMVVK